ncbi:MAG: serine/threonine protein kinase, partial [Myxococcales bacterium]|nr:serine/threonine protein kinase [Myxococcales bacterium]
MTREEPPQGLHSGSGVERLVDALTSAVLDADEQAIVEQARDAGEDIAEAAADLRREFLARVAAARQGQSATLEDKQSISSGSRSAPEDEDESQSIPIKIGRYPILRRLGAGGMGVVYVAYDEVLDRRLAIKVLHAQVWDRDGRRRERLLREAQAMARVSHPNLVTVHEVGAADGQLFVAMEFVSGLTLKEWMQPSEKEERRHWRAVVDVFCQIAQGLAAIHDAGLVHRDVKPANVLIGDDGRVRVLDLGLVGFDQGEQGNTQESDARASASRKLRKPGDQDSGKGTNEDKNEADTGDETDAQRSPNPVAFESTWSGHSSSLNRLASPLTLTGEFLGTPAYMSREQFLGVELTPASDMFSLCVALFEALYGVHPFMGKTLFQLQANVIGGHIAAPPDTHDVPAWLHALVVRGLAMNPGDRPPSMRALASALSADPSRARRRRLATLVVASFAAVVAVVVTRVQTAPPKPSCDNGRQNIGV